MNNCQIFASCSMKFFDTGKLIQNTAGGMQYNESNTKIIVWMMVYYGLPPDQYVT